MRQEAYAGLPKSMVFPMRQPGGAFDLVQKRASTNAEVGSSQMDNQLFG